MPSVDLLGATGQQVGIPGAPVIVSNDWDVLDLTFSLDTGVYADGDLLADTQELANAVLSAGGVAALQSVMVLDESDQKQPFDIVFFDANQSMGSENSAPNISDANAFDVIGVVTVAAADYKDIGGCSIAQLGVATAARILKAASGQTSLWVALVSRGTGTYSASALKLKFGFAY